MLLYVRVSNNCILQPIAATSTDLVRQIQRLLILGRQAILRMFPIVSTEDCEHILICVLVSCIKYV